MRKLAVPLVMLVGAVVAGLVYLVATNQKQVEEVSLLPAPVSPTALAATEPDTAEPLGTAEPAGTAVAVPTEVAGSTVVPRAVLAYRGLNLAGAEFGDSNLPGEREVHYTYPTAEEVDFFVAQGFNTFRVPFRWERLQREIYSDFDPTELAALDALVAAATERGATVVLDPHNYAEYYDDMLGSSAVPIAAFQDLWERLATRYRNDPLVAFGLMNEPVDIDPQTWIDAANLAITGIRDVGATNLILVPGNYYSGAHSWNSDKNGISNAEALLQIVDPVDNYAIEVHQYLDNDSSGTSDRCVNDSIGSRRLTDFTAWLYEHDQRGFLGEFGVGDNGECLRALDDMLDHIDANPDVWLGWTYWAAGPWWGDYIFEVEPTNGVIDDPQFEVLVEHVN